MLPLFVPNIHYINHDLPYDIKSPSEKYVLDSKLKEVSGLSFVSDKEVALIEDENGTIFFYAGII